MDWWSAVIIAVGLAAAGGLISDGLNNLARVLYTAYRLDERNDK